MGSKDADAPVPDPVRLDEDPGRFHALLEALRNPETRTVLGHLRGRNPERPEDVATATGLDPEATRATLARLASVGLVETSRVGLRRQRAYASKVGDVEIRFWAEPRPAERRERTAKILERDAARRAREDRRKSRRVERVQRAARDNGDR